LGDGTLVNKTTSVDVKTSATDSTPISGIVSVSSGGDHTCAVTTAGSVKCWGNNASGQLGDGTLVSKSTPVQVSGLTSDVVSVSAGGSRHTCSLGSLGNVKCWGYNVDGELGDGTLVSKSTPVQVSGLISGSGVVSVSSGPNGAHSCVVTSAGAVKCWGYNGNGQLGGGTLASVRSTPVEVPELTNGVTAVSAGGSHTCSLDSSGGMKCWGYNEFWQTGGSDNPTVPSLKSSYQGYFHKLFQHQVLRDSIHLTQVESLL